MNTADWVTIRNLASWLGAHNGNDPHQQAVQIMKIGEEIGEYYAAITGAEREAELCDVALTALVALHAWADNPEAAYYRVGPSMADGSIVAAHGRAVAAYIGYVGQNPRKGRTHTAQDVADALSRVARAAFTTISWRSHDYTEKIFAAHLANVADRVGVPVGRP